jgi:hypothetical protein
MTPGIQGGPPTLSRNRRHTRVSNLGLETIARWPISFAAKGCGRTAFGVRSTPPSYVALEGSIGTPLVMTV